MIKQMLARDLDAHKVANVAKEKGLKGGSTGIAALYCCLPRRLTAKSSCCSVVFFLAAQT